MSRAVLHGDCLALMPTLDAESVDAIVCDPPAGISFMAKSWDHDKGGRDQWIAWLASVMREGLRVLKPGGHALVWALPRTSHWTGMALEDAGFEVRDQIQHLFGSGFPKSLDVSKAIDRQRDDDPHRLTVGRWLRAQREARGLLQKQVAAHWPSVTGGLTGCVANWEGGFNCPTWEQWLDLKRLIGFGEEMDAEVWRLNGRKGQPGEAWHEREVTGERERSGKPPQYMWGEDDGQKWNDTAPASDLAKQWAGWGTALKPAAEIWWLARKPLAGTVAANVAAHGTGALNIDASRIGYESADLATRTQRTGSQAGRTYGCDSPIPFSNGTLAPPHAAGRWPANVVLSHSPECREVGTRRVKGSSNNPDRFKGTQKFNGKTYAGDAHSLGMTSGEARAYSDADGLETVPAWICSESCPVALLDAQSGERPTGKPTPGTAPLSSATDYRHKARSLNGGGDTGGASRYFLNVRVTEGDLVRAQYHPKASRREREAGLEGMPYGPPPASARSTPAEGRRNALGDPRSNHHPTVKPLALMRWLCRLVTPPLTPDGLPGLVLDPFAGSGSTGCAAVLEGFRFLGIEQDADYVVIAEARLRYWERVARRYHRFLAYRAAHPVERPTVAPNPNQLALFGEVVA